MIMGASTGERLENAGLHGASPSGKAGRLPYGPKRSIGASSSGTGLTRTGDFEVNRLCRYSLSY